jgi:hypothetical protein
MGSQQDTPSTDDTREPKSAQANEKGDEEHKDVKSKLRMMTAKFSAVRRERDALRKENRLLETEVLELQSSIRAMVPGLQNIAGSFPVLTELVNSTDAFYKCDCLDLFFEVLSPELPLTEVLEFFKEAFVTVAHMVAAYFQPVEAAVTAVSAVSVLDKSVTNVLRKSYQVHWEKIFKRFKETSDTHDLLLSLLAMSHLDSDSSYEGSLIQRFVERLSELQLSFYISDPPLSSPVESIGSVVVFNSLTHDSLDGFIRTGDSCYVVLPAVFKTGGDLAVKASVLLVPQL